MESLAGKPQSKPTVTETPEQFRSKLVVDCDGSQRILQKILDPWQIEDYKAIDAGWMRSIGSIETGGKLRAYLERPRGHDKTSGLAVMVAWALYASTRRRSGVAASGSREQAGFLRDAIDRLVAANEWLSEVLEVDKWQVYNKETGSRIKIISSESATSFGAIPDFIVIDELTHWLRKGLWTSLISAAAKRSRCMVVVIANAGMTGTWQWEAREKCRQNASWYFSRLNGSVASWISDSILAEQMNLLPPKAYQRYWGNLWTSGVGDAISGEAIEACCIHERPLDSYDPKYVAYIAGLDLSLNHHHTSLVVLGVNQDTGRLRLAHVKNWTPAMFGGEIHFPTVLNYIREMRDRYRIDLLCYDPWQGVTTGQSLEDEGLKTKKVGNGNKEAKLMATSLIDAIMNRKLEMHRDELLLKDLGKLSIVEKPSGFTIVAPQDEEAGHCDRAMALAVALPTALEFARELHLDPIKQAPGHENNRAMATTGFRPGERW